MYKQKSKYTIALLATNPQLLTTYQHSKIFFAKKIGIIFLLENFFLILCRDCTY